MTFFTKIHESLADIRRQLLSPQFSELPAMKRRLYSLLKVIWIVLKGIREGRLTLRGSSLTYITLVSIVPFLAISFSLAKGLGADDQLLAKINDFTATLPANATEAINKIMEAVQSANIKTIGGVGCLLAVFTSLKLMTNIEKAFNEIWGVKVHRTFVRRFADYISVIITVPMLIVVSSSVTTALSLKSVQTNMEGWFGGLAAIYSTLMSMTGIFSIILAFSVLYMLMPNTKVKIGSALCGGILGGLGWKLMQFCYIKFQVGVSNSDAVLGTFAAIPCFLAWLYASWLIVLFGAEVCFAVQHRKTYELEGQGGASGYLTRKILGVLIVTEICKDFEKGKQEWEAQSFADRFMVPHRLVLDILFVLTGGSVLRKVEGEGHYLPAKDVKSLNLMDVENAFLGDSGEFLERLSDNEFYAKTLAKYKVVLDSNSERMEAVSFAQIIEK